ncbi:sce7725 family protein [Anaerosinus massiliensis]|uniref:sce7725 family protein n=1 Tax=Massilibacillus massiliensis TaxID=1806837 RepID=UPI0022773221|nr:sce7725 family protein [Massilibacillus massiliensis]
MFYIKSFEKNKRKIALIMNPQVGDFIKKLGKEENVLLKEKFIQAARLSMVITTHILNSNSKNQISDLLKIGVKPENLVIICNNEDYIEVYEKMFNEGKPQFNLILDESIFRRRIRDNRVLLADKFNKRERNSAYAGKDEDESFSYDHLYYKDDGYVGFSDYSVVGDGYIESGFAPYAVAIHIVYFDNEKSLRIKHFVSDTNDDINDPAQKFSEAVGKLVSWNKEKRINTTGIKIFEQMFENEIYPGLGTVKKLSIMHHIELMSQYLDGATGR